MKNKKRASLETPLVDEYLQSLQGMVPAQTDPFFYTRLKARMQKEQAARTAAPNFAWAFAICTLVVLLTINCWILLHPQTERHQPVSGTAQQRFEEAFLVGNSLSY